MIAAALGFVLPPLWRTPADFSLSDDPDERNVSIARDRLAELKANKASGGISEAQYDEQVAELEMALSDDLELSKPAIKPEDRSKGRWLIYVLMGAIPLFSIGLYVVLGNMPAIERANDPSEMAQPEQADGTMPSPEAIKQMVAKLADKLKNEPNNLEGWLMLGRSYKVMERYPEAVEAFRRANEIAGEKAETMLPYAEAMALVNQGNWTGQPQELVMKVLAKEPEQPTALWFAAMINAQQGDKKTAVTYLKKLEAVLPADSPDKKQVHDIILSTEGQAVPPPAETASAKDAKTPGSISIQVILADELRTNADPQDTLFIYAQALSGPKMPLAIVRKRVGDLPVKVSLSDADAMMPAMKLSNFKEIKLLARISKSGNAMPQAGDLIGSVEYVQNTGSDVQKIVINNRVD